MADRTTTLKTQTGDNVYPNVIEANLPKTVATYQGVQDFVDMEMSTEIYNHTADSETIVRANEGTKGSDHVKFSLANTLNNKITNSLQKPTGLTKTELVGVGTNGQENIEIGDNLTLVNGKLSASASGGGEAFDIIYLNDNDEITSGSFTGEKPVILNQNNGYFLYSQSFANIDGTRTLIITEAQGIKYNVKVYSNDNLITSADGSYLYSHFITIQSGSDLNINFNYYSTTEEAYTADTMITALAGKHVACSGYVVDGGTYQMAMEVTSSNGQLQFSSFDPSDGSTTANSFSSLDVTDSVSAVE